ncbi:cytosolic phospholipase A2 gamma-like [Pangshura tecta]
MNPALEPDLESRLLQAALGSVFTLGTKMDAIDILALQKVMPELLDAVLGNMQAESPAADRLHSILEHVVRVRLSHELSAGEKEATENRKAKVLECLKSLGIAHDEDTKDNMPNITILGSGGGLRAMIALQGTLVEMKKQGLLDAVLYLCGVSGSTWCMSTLYKDKDWTEKVQDLEERLCDTLSKSSWDLHKAYSLVCQAANDELFSLTDVWASFIVYKILNQYDQTTLSQQDDASTSGTNPYPIYAALEAKISHKADENSPGNWFEFTPHESGFPGLGAFVCTKNLGSKFRNGKLKDKNEEKSICYLQGLWGSIFGSMEENMKYLKEFVLQIFSREPRRELQYAVGGAENMSEMAMPPLGGGTHCTCAHCQSALLLLNFHGHASAGEDYERVFEKLKEALKEHKGKNSYQKCCEMSDTWGSKTLAARTKEYAEFSRIFETEHGGNVSSTCKLFWKICICIFHWRWGSTHNFLYKCRDAESTGLDKDEVINLIDAGISINSAYPLVLRPERKVKLILSFDFSNKDPFGTIKKTAKYCEANHIPFPKIDPEKLKDTDTPSSCYIFKGKDVPTVMHFPLFNKENCPDKIHDFRERYSTFHFSYNEDDVKELLKRAKMNVSNNKERIRDEIQQIVSSSTKKF